MSKSKLERASGKQKDAVASGYKTDLGVCNGAYEVAEVRVIKEICNVVRDSESDNGDDTPGQSCPVRFYATSMLLS